MSKIKELILKNKNCLNFITLAACLVTVLGEGRNCFFIVHQPKMPEALRNKKN